MDTTVVTGPLFVGVDLGGTNIKAGVVDDSGTSLSVARVPTEADRGCETGLVNICCAVDEALENAGLTIDDVTGIGLATPGTMDIPAGMLLEPPNLPGWNYFPIRDRLAAHFDKQTVLQNDGNAAAYGEYWVGAGRGVKSLVLWTLGTGVGGGIIINNNIICGKHSHGAECGHVIVEMDNGRLCGTGQRGTLEAYAGANALIQRCREALDAGRESVLALEIAGGAELTPILIAQAAEEGDELADELIMDTARYMGIGTTTIMHVIDPDMILFGGAMTFGRDETELGRRFMQRIRDEVRQRAFPVSYENTTIDYATLGGDAGYIGAAGYARLKFTDRRDAPPAR